MSILFCTSRALKSRGNLSLSPQAPWHLKSIPLNISNPNESYMYLPSHGIQMGSNPYNFLSSRCVGTVEIYRNRVRPTGSVPPMLKKRAALAAQQDSEA